MEPSKAELFQGSGPRSALPAPNVLGDSWVLNERLVGNRTAFANQDGVVVARPKGSLGMECWRNGKMESLTKVEHPVGIDPLGWQVLTGMLRGVPSDRRFGCHRRG